MVTSQTCLASGLRGVRLVDMAGMLITSPNGSGRRCLHHVIDLHHLCVSQTVVT